MGNLSTLTSSVHSPERDKGAYRISQGKLNTKLRALIKAGHSSTLLCEIFMRGGQIILSDSLSYQCLIQWGLVDTRCLTHVVEVSVYCWKYTAQYKNLYFRGSISRVFLEAINICVSFICFIGSIKTIMASLLRVLRDYGKP